MLCHLHRLAIAGLLGVLFAAGCVNKDGGNAPRIKQPATAVRGGILHLPLTIRQDDAALTSLDTSDPRLWALARCLEVPLMRAGQDGSFLPGLASGCISAEGGKKWAFELRSLPENPEQPGYLGEHFVQHCKDLLRGPQSPLRAQLADLVVGAADFAAGRGSDISGITLDGSTLDIELTRPHQRFPLWLSQPGLGILPERSLPAGGFGPFALTELNGNELVLKPNPRSLDGPPLLDELRFYCLPERKEQLAAFRAGTLHSANVPWEEVTSLTDDPELSSQLRKHVTAAMYLGIFDLQQAPWGDAQFQSKLGLRESVNQVLNVPVLAEGYGGQFASWRHFIAPVFSDYLGAALELKPVFSNSPEIEKARAGQKAADHEQGSFLTPGADLGYRADGIVEDHLVREILRMWREISVKMKPMPLPPAELLRRVDEGRHEILLVQHRPAWPDVDAALYPLLHSSLIGAGGNASMLGDDKIDAALEAGQGAAEGTARRKVYQTLCETVETRALAVFLGNSTPSLLISPQIAGLVLSPYDYDASFQAQDFSKLGLSDKEY